MNVKNKKENWLVSNWKDNPLFSTVFALLVLVVLQTISMGFDYPSFGVWFQTWLNNWFNILRNNAAIGVVALGMTFVIISGGIDLAVGSTLVAISAVMMFLMDQTQNGLLNKIGITGSLSMFIAIILALIFGVFLGSINGFFITKGRIPPFIATLGTMKMLRSITQHITKSTQPIVPPAFLNIANKSIGGYMILPIIYWLIAALIMNYISKNTYFGRQIFAVGSSERTSKLSGINTDKVKMGVYALMGLLIGIASVMQVSRIGSMDFANAGSGYEMDAIAAVIVGGTSMSGGRGSIWGTVIGMLIIAVVNNLLNLLGVPPFLREAFKGAIVIFAVLLQKKEEIR